VSRRRPAALPLAALVVAVAALLPVAPSGARAGAPPPTHRTVLDSLARRVAGELLAGAEIPAGRTVALQQPIAGDTLGALGQRLVEGLKARGLGVRVTSAPGAWAAGGSPAVATGPEPEDLRLQVRVPLSAVAYVRPIRGFPWRVTAYERLAILGASATLMDGPSGAVLWARSATAEHRDRVGKGEVAEAAAGSGSFSPAPPKGGGPRLLEPLLVAGVIAGLVVLFYSNRN
jgi:hypothetical protein